MLEAKTVVQQDCSRIHVVSLGQECFRLGVLKSNEHFLLHCLILYFSLQNVHVPLNEIVKLFVYFPMLELPRLIQTSRVLQEKSFQQKNMYLVLCFIKPVVLLLLLKPCQNYPSLPLYRVGLLLLIIKWFVSIRNSSLLDQHVKLVRPTFLHASSVTSNKCYSG